MNDTDDFSRWFETSYRPVHATLSVLTGDRALAEEATIEAFVRALERWPRVRAMDSPRAWVLTVARNQARRLGRRAAIEQRIWRRSRLEPTEDPELPHPVWDAVARLPIRQRTAIALRYLGDLPEAEVAAFMGIARGTVAATLSNARHELERQLTALNLGRH